MPSWCRLEEQPGYCLLVAVEFSSTRLERHEEEEEQVQFVERREEEYLGPVLPLIHEVLEEKDCALFAAEIGGVLTGRIEGKTEKQTGLWLRWSAVAVRKTGKIIFS